MRRTIVRFGALVVPLLVVPVLASENGRAAADRATSPTPAASPGRRADDPVSGAPEVGVGRATGAVKGSGDEGGTAAGMPGGGAESGR